MNIPKEKKTAGYREVKETNNTPGTEVTGYKVMLYHRIELQNCQMYELPLGERIATVFE